MREKLSVPTLAWCAGVTDVLGNIRLRELDTGAQVPAVYASSARIDLCDRLGELTGIKTVSVFRNYNRLGCGEHCDEPHQHVMSTTGRWSLTGIKATVFLNAVLPYLQTKRADAEEALAAGLVAPYKPGVLTKMYDLGWPELQTA